MIDFAKTPLLTATLTLGLLSTASASLTEAQDNALRKVTPVAAEILVEQFPAGDIGTQVTAARAVLGTPAQWIALYNAMLLLMPAGGFAPPGAFGDGTVGQAIPLDLPDTSYSTQDAAIRSLLFNILNTGVIGGGNQSAILAGYTQDTVTWAVIAHAVINIANHG